MIVLLGIAATVGGLTGPSFATVRRVTSIRPYAPLVRGSLERACVLAVAGLAAAIACAEIFGALSSVLQATSYERFEWLATPVFFLAAPPVIGLAPWAAGEILSGPSIRQDISVLGSGISEVDQIVKTYTLGIQAIGDLDALRRGAFQGQFNSVDHEEAFDRVCSGIHFERNLGPAGNRSCGAARAGEGAAGSH